MTREEALETARKVCPHIYIGEYFNTWYCGLRKETSCKKKFCEKWNGGGDCYFTERLRLEEMYAVDVLTQPQC